MLESPAYTHCWSSDACAGWGMWYAWTTAGSPSISSMVSWHKANARLADPNCDTKMSARGTWRPWMSTLPHGKLQPRIGLPDSRLCKKACPASNSHSHSRLRQSVRVEKPETRQNDWQWTSPAPSVEGTATPASDFPATPDAAQE